MELTNTNRSRAYPDRLGMDVEKIRKRISVFSFEGLFLHYSSIAQSVEHAAVNRAVVGSSPTRGVFLSGKS